MSRKLKSVEALPDQQVAEKLLGLSANDILDGNAEEIGDSEAVVMTNHMPGDRYVTRIRPLRGRLEN
jgi:hypothetical protein